MDPDAAFSMLLDSIADEDWDSAAEFAESLQTWLGRGGFLPGNGKLRRTSIERIVEWTIRTSHVSKQKGAINEGTK